MPVEVSGEAGANYYTYWVCNYLGGPFIEVARLQPDDHQGVAAIKRYLTGVLDAYVTAYPAFPGTEADYLRALVGRIASATVVCPAGYFAVRRGRGR